MAGTKLPAHSSLRDAQRMQSLRNEVGGMVCELQGGCRTFLACLISSFSFSSCCARAYFTGSCDTGRTIHCTTLDQLCLFSYVMHVFCRENTSFENFSAVPCHTSYQLAQRIIIQASSRGQHPSLLTINVGWPGPAALPNKGYAKHTLPLQQLSTSASNAREKTLTHLA